jgi:antirestriction protein ArdC
LAAIVKLKGFDCNTWISRSKLKELGGQPVAMESPAGSIYMNRNVSKTDKPFYRERYYPVYNLDQTENLPAKFYEYRKPKKAGTKFTSFAPDLAASIGVDLATGAACYNPESDTLTVPEAKSFKTKAEHEAMICRGLALACSHSDRLDRELTDMVFEQLICELVAFELMGQNDYIKVKSDPALISQWTDKMDKKDTYLSDAAKQADRIVRFITEGTVPQKAETPVTTNVVAFG